MRPKFFFAATTALALLTVTGCNRGARPVDASKASEMNPNAPGMPSPTGGLPPAGSAGVAGANPNQQQREAANPPITMAAGTRIAVRMSSTLSTKTAAAGQPFSGELAQPLMVDGQLVA